MDADSAWPHNALGRPIISSCQSPITFPIVKRSYKSLIQGSEQVFVCLFVFYFNK